MLGLQHNLHIYSLPKLSILDMKYYEPYSVLSGIHALTPYGICVLLELNGEKLYLNKSFNRISEASLQALSTGDYVLTKISNSESSYKLLLLNKSDLSTEHFDAVTTDFNSTDPVGRFQEKLSLVNMLFNAPYKVLRGRKMGHAMYGRYILFNVVEYAIFVDGEHENIPDEALLALPFGNAVLKKIAVPETDGFRLELLYYIDVSAKLINKLKHDVNDKEKFLELLRPTQSQPSQASQPMEILDLYDLKFNHPYAIEKGRGIQINNEVSILLQIEGNLIRIPGSHDVLSKEALSAMQYGGCFLKKTLKNENGDIELQLFYNLEVTQFQQLQ